MRSAYSGGLIDQGDANLLCLDPGVPTIDDDELKSIDKERRVKDYAFEKAPPGRENYQRVSVLSVAIAKQELDDMDYEILTQQEGQQELAVASLMIYACTKNGREILQRTRIHLIPLDQWKERVKKWATQARMMGRIDGRQGDQRHLAQSARKIMTLIGRDT